MTFADLRAGLRAYLIADPAIAAVVGSDAATARVYPVQLPQGQTQPSIVYQRVTGQGDHHMQGASGLSRPRLQIDCWAQDADTAATLADLVKERIDGFRGELHYGESSPSDVVAVQGVFFDNEADDYDPAAELYRTRGDYFVWFEERR